MLFAFFMAATFLLTMLSMAVSGCELSPLTPNYLASPLPANMLKAMSLKALLVILSSSLQEFVTIQPILMMLCAGVIVYLMFRKVGQTAFGCLWSLEHSQTAPLLCKQMYQALTGALTVMCGTAAGYAAVSLWYPFMLQLFEHALPCMAVPNMCLRHCTSSPRAPLLVAQTLFYNFYVMHAKAGLWSGILYTCALMVAASRDGVSDNFRKHMTQVVSHFGQSATQLHHHSCCLECNGPKCVCHWLSWFSN